LKLSEKCTLFSFSSKTNNLKDKARIEEVLEEYGREAWAKTRFPLPCSSSFLSSLNQNVTQVYIPFWTYNCKLGEYVFFQLKLQNHREERMAAGALVYTTRNNFICRSRFLTISLICAVSVVTKLLGNS